MTRAFSLVIAVLVVTAVALPVLNQARLIVT
jgi:hypothetical protein